MAGQMAASNWETARDWIRAAIASSTWSQGDRLPTEQELQSLIEVGRHSLRRAVAALAAEGTLSVEQGRGTFVGTRRQYRLRAGGDIASQLQAQGAALSAEMIEMHEAPANDEETAIFGEGTCLRHVLSLFTVAGQGLFLRQCRRLAGVGEENDVLSCSATGSMPFAVTLHVRLPLKWEARLLEQPANQPVVVTRCECRSAGGKPVAMIEDIWAAGRVVFDLPRVV